MKLAFLFTCYNRIEKTRECIESISSAVQYANARLAKSVGDTSAVIETVWFVVDGGSSDGTQDMLADYKTRCKMHTRVENGAYYSQGMRACMELAHAEEKCDFYFIINDDVDFYEDCIYLLLQKYGCIDNDSLGDFDKTYVVAGATDCDGCQTYGGVRYVKGAGKKNHFIPRSVSYSMVSIEDEDKSCHTFNANCVMIPGEVFDRYGFMDKAFIHSLGDFDLGMNIYESNAAGIIASDFYVGRCANNSKDNTWQDKTLSRMDRIRKLNSVKGAPSSQWFHYLYKHFGLATAIAHSISPYVRIIAGR